MADALLAPDKSNNMVKNNKKIPFRPLIPLLALFLFGCVSAPQKLGGNSTDSTAETVAMQTLGSDDAAASAQDNGDTEAGAADPDVDTDPAHQQLLKEDPDFEAQLNEDPDPDHITVSAEDQSAIGETTNDTASDTDSQDDDATDNNVADNNNIWQRIRAGYALPEKDKGRTLAEINWYARHQAYIDRTVDRARPYLYLIVNEVESRGMPTEISLLPVVESAFQPFAYSHGRAAGIWQFIPSTGRIYGLKQDWWYDGRRDIMSSTKAALKYLSTLQQEFDGDWLLALAAYNSGQGTVKKAIAYNRRRGRATDFWSLKLPRETRGYVPKLLAVSAIIKNPEQYGIELKPIPDEPYLASVDTDSQIDLALAAELAGIPLQDLYRYNPAFNRWATSPDGPHHLLVPTTVAAQFEDQLNQLPDSKRIKWARHKIRNGETLSEIAEHYHTTTHVLRQVNNIRGTMIRAGHNLIIPVSTRNLKSYSLSASQRAYTTRNTPHRGEKLVHRVRRGETLWDLSRRYNISVRQLAEWNSMAPRDVLREGQKLVIWHNTGSMARPLNVSELVSNNALQKIQYIVRRGDSLSRISQKFNVKVSQLRSWNSLPVGKYLQPGQRLTLFVDVTRQSDT